MIPLSEWPAELRYQFEERAGIKMDSHIPQAQAEAQAMRETWEREYGREAEQMRL